MIPSCIPYTRSSKATALFLDYLYHFDRVQEFYGGPPQEFSSYQRVAQAISGSYPHREELVEILERQNRAFGCGEETLANIRRLRDPKVFTVVTGQQVGLFSGPAFTLYKALTAVRVAQSLKDQGLPAVPVFWLATEDHDLEEVAKTAILNEAGELVFLEAAGDRPAPASSVGYVRFTEQIRELLGALEQTLPEGEPRARLMEDLRSSYLPGAGWGEAFAHFMTRLFSRFGVILLDPLNDPIHRLAQSIYERAIGQAARLRSLLQDRSRTLEKSKYHAQVHVGDDSTLLFASTPNGRTAIHQKGEQFYLEGRAPSSMQQLQAQLAAGPLDFTPSALLRPVIQDSILPSVAYVAGPAELAYFAQAQTIYAEFGRPVPVLVPRAGFTLADRRQQRLIEKYHLSLEDVWEGKEHLGRKIAAAGLNESGAGDWAARMERGENSIKELFEGLRQDVERIDPTLVDAARNTQEKMAYQLERLRGKISRAALDRSELLSRHEQELLRFLAPAGNFQEREVSGIYFLGRAGYEILDRLLAQLRTQCMDHQFLAY